MPPSPGVRLSRCCAYQGSFRKSSKSVVNSLSISAKVPVFQGFSEIIKVVMLTNEEFVTTNESRDGGPAFDYTDCVMEQAYLVTDRYEYTGIPKNENDSFPGAWNVEFPNAANRQYLRLVYFDDTIDVSKYEGEEIKFSAKAFRSSSSLFDYYDAIIIE